MFAAHWTDAELDDSVVDCDPKLAFAEHLSPRLDACKHNKPVDAMFSFDEIWALVHFNDPLRPGEDFLDKQPDDDLAAIASSLFCSPNFSFADIELPAAAAPAAPVMQLIPRDRVQFYGNLKLRGALSSRCEPRRGAMARTLERGTSFAEINRMINSPIKQTPTPRKAHRPTKANTPSKRMCLKQLVFTDLVHS